MAKPPIGVHPAAPATGGCTRGAPAPLVGGAARFWRRGGNPPAPAFPRQGETGKGEFKFPAAAGDSTCALRPIPHAASSPQVLVATEKPEVPPILGVARSKSSGKRGV